MDKTASSYAKAFIVLLFAVCILAVWHTKDYLKHVLLGTPKQPAALTVKEFLKIASSYKDDADFIFIYVSEAHPVDGWYTASSPFSISNHQNLAERFEAAELLKGVVKDSVPIFVDNMKDEAALAYGALPERLYIVRNGSVVFEGGGGPYFYSLEKMEKSLVNILRS